MGFAENLRLIRKKRNMTQEELAELLSVSRQAISKWEAELGYPETETLLVMSKKLNVSLDYLFSDKCNMTKSVMGERISKEDTYLNCAQAFAYRSTCLKGKYGAVIVKNDIIISTGYNGSPRGFDNCCDLGTCPRIDKNLFRGEGYELCRAVHAETNALLNCSREQTIGADLYIVGITPNDNSILEAKPCPLCSRNIIQAGIKNIYIRVSEGRDNYIVIPSNNLNWLKKD